MDKEQRLNLISALFTMIIGIAFLFLSRGIEVKAKNGDVGSAFFPILVGVLMIILSAVYLITTIIALKKKQNIVITDAKKSSQKEEVTKLKDDYKKVIWSFAFLIVYAALLKPLGFVIGSMCYLFFQVNLMTDHPTKKQEAVFIALAIGVPIIVNLIFVNGFSMALPQGILG